MLIYWLMPKDQELLKRNWKRSWRHPILRIYGSCAPLPRSTKLLQPAQNGKFIPNLASLIHTLNALLHHECQWKWSDRCEAVFETYGAIYEVIMRKFKASMVPFWDLKISKHVTHVSSEYLISCMLLSLISMAGQTSYVALAYVVPCK